MRTCKQCGGEIKNKLCRDFCVPCLERAMDELTADDIGTALRDIELKPGAKSEPLGAEFGRVCDENSQKLNEN